MLEEFFVVTMTSVYRVKSQDGQYGHPSATKIATNGESLLGLGYQLKRGSMIAICQQLIIYIPEGGGLATFQRKIEEVNIQYWGGNTSPIAALFLKMEDAIRCHNEKDLQPCDSRWVDKTIEVLKSIGENHPTISICTFPSLRLIEPEKWRS